MKKTVLLLSFVLVCFISGANTQGLIQNVNSRTSSSLNGNWGYSLDPLETGYYNYKLIPYEEINWSRNYNLKIYYDEACFIIYDYCVFQSGV